MMCSRRLTSIVLSAAALLVGCEAGGSGGDGGRDAARADAAPLSLIDVDVELTSSVPSFDGRVLVGAFRQSPPTMPPVALSRLDAPSFPANVTLRDIQPGTYYVIAVLDRDPPSPTIPGPEDTTSTSDPIVVTGGESAPISVALSLVPPPTP